MPHIPKNPGMAPTFTRPHDVVGTVPRKKVAASAPRPAAKAEAVPAGDDPVQVGTISLRKHTVDPKDVAKVIFGKEPEYGRAGELVYPRNA